VRVSSAHAVFSLSLMALLGFPSMGRVVSLNMMIESFGCFDTCCFLRTLNVTSS
jgi:hypothetical protein